MMVETWARARSSTGSVTEVGRRERGSLCNSRRQIPVTLVSVVTWSVLAIQAFLDCAKIVLEACYDDAAPNSEVEGRRRHWSKFRCGESVGHPPPETSRGERRRRSSRRRGRRQDDRRDNRHTPDMTRRNEISAFTGAPWGCRISFPGAPARPGGRPGGSNQKPRRRRAAPPVLLGRDLSHGRLALGEHDVQSRLDAVDDVDHEAQDAVRDALVKAGLGPRATDRLRAAQRGGFGIFTLALG